MFWLLKDVIARRYQMLADKRRLMLVEITEINFKDRQTGEPVKKFKYDFIDQDSQPFTAYSDTKKYADRVVTSAGYLDTKAFDYDLHGKIWADTIKWSLVL